MSDGIKISRDDTLGQVLEHQGFISFITVQVEFRLTVSDELLNPSAHTSPGVEGGQNLLDM